MKKIAILIIFGIGMLISPSVFSETFPPENPNYIGFYMDDNRVTIDDIFNVTCYVIVASEVDTASIENLTFTPGIVTYQSTTQGDLFPSGTIVWLTPESNGEINNVGGYAYPITWSSTTTVNGVTRNLSIITMNAINCGVATLSPTAGGTALGGVDPGTTFLSYNIEVHPKQPTGFTTTAINDTKIHLSWNKEKGADKTVICSSQSGYPTNPNISVIYNGTDNETDFSCGIGEHWYFSAWGYNTSSNFYSLLYATSDATSLGGNNPPNHPELWLPANNSDYESVYNQVLKVNISDPDGDLMDVYFYWGNSTLIGRIENSSNGTCVFSVANFLLPTWKDWLEHDTTYTWYVVVNDSEFVVQSNNTFYFTTSKAWDLNEDRIVNYLDISMMTANYLAFVAHPGEDPWDVNNDVLSNYLDLSSVVGHYLETY